MIKRGAGDGGETENPPHRDGGRRGPAWSTVSRLLLILFGTLAVRLALRANHPEGWDSIDFALGLVAYDLERFQPHFPGYPVYILLGRLFLPFTSDPVQALTTLSAVSGSAALLPFYLLARRFVPPAAALAGTAALAAAPLPWLLGEAAMSEAVALPWLLAGVAAAAHALPPVPLRKAGPRLGAAGILLGVMLGIRLSYFPLLAVLAVTAACRGRAELRRIALYPLLGLLLGTLPWLGWMMAEEGADRLWRLALAFSSGHWEEWGGSVAAAGAGPARWFRLFYTDLLAYGLGFVRSDAVGWRLFPTVTLLAGWLLGCRRLVRRRDATTFLAGLSLPYALWIGIAQNPAQPRHVLPLLVPLLLLAAVGLSEADPAGAGPAAPRLPGGRRAVTRLPLLLLPVSLLVVAAPLAARHARTPPPMVALADFLAARYDPKESLVLTWEEERVIEYHHPAFYAVRLQSLPTFYETVLQWPRPPAHLLLTSSVLDGFGCAGAPIRKRVTRVATFQGDPWIYPTYWRIDLYEALPALHPFLRRTARTLRADGDGGCGTHAPPLPSRPG